MSNSDRARELAALKVAARAAKDCKVYVPRNLTMFRIVCCPAAPAPGAAGQQTMTAELDALRERITADGRHWRALIGFATLIRNRLAASRLSRREYADDFAFLRIELAAGIGVGHAALIEYGVRSGRERHTVGVVTGRWEDAELHDVRAWEEGQPCQIAEAWQWIERTELDAMPELREAQRGRAHVLN